MFRYRSIGVARATAKSLLGLAESRPGAQPAALSAGRPTGSFRPQLRRPWQKARLLPATEQAGCVSSVHRL